MCPSVHCPRQLTSGRTARNIIASLLAYVEVSHFSKNKEKKPSILQTPTTQRPKLPVSTSATPSSPTLTTRPPLVKHFPTRHNEFQADVPVPEKPIAKAPSSTLSPPKAKAPASELPPATAKKASTSAVVSSARASSRTTTINPVRRFRHNLPPCCCGYTYFSS